LRDATAAIASLGYTGRQGEHMKTGWRGWKNCWSKRNLWIRRS
jgi:hypothetical protein